MKKRLSFILALVLALAALHGCAPKVIGDVDGNRVEVQGDTLTITGDDGNATINTGGNLPWPKDKMGDIPELSGNIITVIDTDDGVAVSLDGISKSDYNAYIAKLKAQGYEASYEAEMDGTLLFMGQTDDAAISVQLHLDGDKGTCIIIYGDS